MKKLKRLFSVLLTFALVMSFSVSVFAAETSAGFSFDRE